MSTAYVEEGGIQGCVGREDRLDGLWASAVTMMFDTLAGSFAQLSGMNWVPQQGWAYAGGEWTVCIGGNRGVFVETAKADFNRLFEALVGER